MPHLFKNYRLLPVLALALGWGLPSCAPNQDVPSPSGGVDTSRYLAVGDSYTAGFTSGGLTRAGQEYSFPNLLARQIGGGASFTQPLLEAGTGAGYLTFVGTAANGSPLTRRVAGQALRGGELRRINCTMTDTLRLLNRVATPTDALPWNLGVPGLRLTQIETIGLGNATQPAPAAFNPYFERLLPAADNRTYLQAVTSSAQRATFFTFFQGLDDLMPYVRSGGVCTTLRPSTTVMRANARKLLDQLTANGRPGIIAQLPDLRTLPLLRLGKGDVVQARMQTVYGDTAKLYVESKFIPGTAVPLTSDDYVLATALPRVGQLMPVTINGVVLQLPYGRDSRNPLADADVLDKGEFNDVNIARSSYNTDLKRLATEVYKMPLLDAANTNSALDLDLLFFGQVADRISVNGVVYSLDALRGGVFAADYYSLTPRGNALLANIFIRAINQAYGTSFASLNANGFPGTAE